MSFLPARQAVQTCVLSRRWEDLWCSMPCISIDQQEFDMAASGRFEEFVNSLLMFHKAPSLEMFRFHVTRPYKFEVVSRWFRRGIKCCPEVVELSSKANFRFYRLPHLGPSAHRLRRLHLVSISLDKTVMQHLSSACPVLEVLELNGCILDPPEISSSSLQHLILKDYKSYGQVLMITAPALVSFYLVCNLVQWNWSGVLVNEMPTLVNATVCLKQDRRSNPPKVPCKILCSLMKVRNLELSGLDRLLALHEDSGIIPTFSNLRTLLFNGCDLSDDFQMLGYFMNNTPSLEKLTLQYCKLPEDSKKRKRMENPKRIPIKCHDTLTFQCPNLKLIEIKYKEDDVHQLFGLLSGIWRNLLKTTIILTKA
ncbi:hypothetical protein HU200_005791 [Digitaria exilis]|uniref:F-box/LRR-repeat protein 15/At3g58940/PEG3-like LRR domain-containing protein n=1 Tax=Digitaria exilis TaxID=1010633 RepID=A0A835FSJ9_9POAL|nr:hypothetical protein HU200_005791 [Digitaria exilis]